MSDAAAPAADGRAVDPAVAVFGHGFSGWKMRVDADLAAIRSDLTELRRAQDAARIAAARREGAADVQAAVMTEMAAREEAMLDRLNGIDTTLARLATALEGVRTNAPALTVPEMRRIGIAVVTALLISGAVWLVSRAFGAA